MGSIARIPACVLEKSVFLCIPPEDELGGGEGGGGVPYERYGHVRELYRLKD